MKKSCMYFGEKWTCYEEFSCSRDNMVLREVVFCCNRRLCLYVIFTLVAAWWTNVCSDGCSCIGQPELRQWRLGPVSLRLMTSQFQVIVTRTQKMKTVKCIFCGVWVQNFAWNFKGPLWNFTQNFEPIHRKICILRGVKNWRLTIS